MVDVSCKNDKLETVWVPALIVTEIEEDGEKKFIVKCCNGDELKPNKTVDACDIRPIPPPFDVEEYKLLDRVDTFHGAGWRQSLVRGIHTEKRYTVNFLATKEELVFKHSDLRPSMEWEDGVWHQRTKRKLEKETPSDGKRKMSVASETTLSEFTALFPPKKLKIIRSSTAAKSINLSSLSAGGNASITPEGIATCIDTAIEENESAPPVTPVINVTPVKEPEAETQGMASPEKTFQPTRKKKQDHNSNLKETGEACNGSETLITDTSDSICDDDYDQLLSSWILGIKSSTGSDKPKLSPNAVKNSAADEANENTMVLPFAKQSPIWKALESMEVFKTVKQSPHFIPLLQTREEFREGSAVGEMVKFFSLLERVKNLQLQVPISTLERLKECFFEFEKYGFDVTAPISRINMMLSLKDKQVNRVEELNYKEKEITEKVIKKQRFEEDLREVEHKILELRSQEADLKEKNDALEKDITQMQLCAADLNKKIQDVELEFQSVMSAPW